MTLGVDYGSKPSVTVIVHRGLGIERGVKPPNGSIASIVVRHLRDSDHYLSYWVSTKGHHIVICTHGCCPICGDPIVVCVGPMVRIESLGNGRDSTTLNLGDPEFFAKLDDAIRHLLNALGVT